MRTFNKPVVLNPLHQVDEFNCGIGSIDMWLEQNSWATQAAKTHSTFVVVEDNLVVGFYTLSLGSMSRGADIFPVMVINRLAVDKSAQGHGLGASLLQDAVAQSLSLGASNWGFKAFVAYAEVEKSVAFYQRCGFIPSGVDPMTLIMPLEH